MNTRTKIFSLLFATVVVFLLLFIIFINIQKKQNKLLVDSFSNQQNVLIDAALYTKNDQLRQLVTDYTNWDDIVYYLKNIDNQWANDNISSIINSFHLQNVKVFDDSVKLIYEFHDELSPTISIPLNPLLFHKLNNNRFISFYYVTDRGLALVYGATIHPGADTERKTPPRGYFFICKIWDQDFIQTLENNTASRIRLDIPPVYSTNAEKPYQIRQVRPMKDFYNNVIANVIFTKDNPFESAFQNLSNFSLYFLISMILGIFILVVSGFYFWVDQPVKTISKGLTSAKLADIEKLSRKNNEFGRMAQLIKLFNRQKDELIAENQNRKKIEEKILFQSSILQGVANAANTLLIISDYEQAILQALKDIGQATKADRVYLFERWLNPVQNKYILSQRYEWVNHLVIPQIDNPVFQNMAEEAVFSRWIGILSRGEAINSFVKDLPYSERKLLENHQVISLLVVPVFVHGDFWGFIGFDDCTRHRKWEADEVLILKAMAGNLGGFINRKQVEYDLQHAVDRAKAADTAKSEFLATMSHEIRTPMNGVIGMTSLLLQTELSETQKDYVETIRISGDNLLNIINDILDFSKIESGKMELELTKVSLRNTIEEVLDLLAPRAFEKHIDLMYMIEPAIPDLILGDLTRIRQVIVNLVGNALKFTDKGEVVIWVKETLHSEEYTELEFSVRDTGIGISPEKSKNLFTPFTQVDASTTRKYGGTGLGLAISAKLVNMMNGKIWVDSKLNEGSTFYFTLQTKYLTGPKSDLEPGSVLQSVKGKTILIVDDNKTNRQILQNQIENWGMKVFTASSGSMAMEFINQNIPIDLAILDMQMPEMDGLELGNLIRKKYKKDQFPLVMLSSLLINDQRDKNKIFNAYVNKPVKHTQLFDILTKVILKIDIAPVKLKSDHKIIQKIAESIPLNILVAEDNTINQKLILKVFDMMGYKADIAANGLEVLDALQRQNYDIIFMDIQMPEMDGFEATQKIMERWKERRPLIVAMTANAMQTDREKCLNAGMDNYISKPISLKAVQDIILKYEKIKLNI